MFFKYAKKNRSYSESFAHKQFNLNEMKPNNLSLSTLCIQIQQLSVCVRVRTTLMTSSTVECV